MALLRSARWLVLALAVFGVAAQQTLGQYAPGTTRTGTFIWDGARWLPVETPVVQAPAFDVDASEPVVSATIAPPPLPVYDQPPCPQPDLLWTPGYWAWGTDGYYWVPGAWVPAPYRGALWTPPYWGWSNGIYIHHGGYWGDHVGYYGGVNYGFGFGGIGFAGGEWRGGSFAYNTAVVHVNLNFVHVTFVDQEVVQRGIIANPNHVAFSGGPGGIQHQPTPAEASVAHESHLPPTTFQKQHVETAKVDKTSYAKSNGGHPAHLAAAKPLAEEKHTPPPPKPAPTPVAKPLPPTPATKPVPPPVAKPLPPTPATKPAPPPVAKPVPPTPATKPAPPPVAKPVPPTPAAKPVHTPDAKPVPPPAAKPTPQPTAKPEPKPAAKPAPKPEAKPAAKPEPKKKEEPKTE
jgi:hypothetical protein